MTVYSAHQPDFLPYTGFFYKVWNADIFEIKIFDQIQGKPGYQRRVKMRDQWVSVPLVKHSSYAPINEVLVDVDKAYEYLSSEFNRLYDSAPGWAAHKDWLFGTLDSACSDPHLWRFNTRFIVEVCARLGIDTPLLIPTEAPVGRGSVGIIDAMLRWPEMHQTRRVYLSGAGGRSYMGDCAEFTAADIEVRWSNHAAPHGNSILDVLMDGHDPLSLVLAEHQHDTTTTGSEIHQ